jgi:hypothetical protein
MPQRIRIADRFKSQSAEQLVAMAGAIIAGLTNNPAFAAPTVDIKTVQAAADDLNAALAAQIHGGTAELREQPRSSALQRLSGCGGYSRSFASCQSFNPQY